MVAGRTVPDVDAARADDRQALADPKLAIREADAVTHAVAARAALLSNSRNKPVP